MYQPQNGDILKKNKQGFLHYGIYVGNGLVFQNTPEKGEHDCSFQEFANGQPVTCISISQDKREEVMSRLSQSLSNAKQYNLLFNNCEHTVTRIVVGQAFSPQLQKVVFAFGFSFLIISTLYLLAKRSA